MIELIILTLATLLGTLLALEAKAWIPYLGRRLLASAIARLPNQIDETTRVRWAKEIEADFRDFDDRPLGGLAFAFRVYRKGGRDLAAELALSEKIALGEEQQQTSVEVSPTVGASDFQLVTLVRFLVPVIAPINGVNRVKAEASFAAVLADWFDEAGADLRLQVADGLTRGAADYAARFDGAEITADDIRRFAARLRTGPGSRK